MSEVQVIAEVCQQIGVTNRTNSLLKSIEGLNGMNDAV